MTLNYRHGFVPESHNSIHILWFLQVAEKLMLAHCEQELAHRARIVNATRATVQLPPFAQVCYCSDMRLSIQSGLLTIPDGSICICFCRLCSRFLTMSGRNSLL